MAAIARTHKASAGLGLAGRVVAAIQRMQENRARHALHRQMARELNALADNDLASLGLDRPMIDRLAREAAWGR